MKIIQSIFVAFSMFSAIPVPYFSWDKKNTGYMLLFFPLVGAVCGGFFVLFCFLGDLFDFSNLFLSSILCLTPIILTGGVHLDGYCDTLDARSSHQSREKKIEILKDPHIGAFGVLGLICYLLFQWSIFYELDKPPVFYPVFFLVFILSRCLSGLSVVILPQAKNNGLSATFSQDADTVTVRVGLLFFLSVGLIFLLIYQVFLGIYLLITMFLVGFSWKNMILKEFGGITGDLSGYFLQKIEFYSFLSILLYQKTLYPFLSC